eukprot:37897-Chlamydomonas_euryale.AAC.23
MPFHSNGSAYACMLQGAAWPPPHHFGGYNVPNVRRQASLVRLNTLPAAQGNVYGPATRACNTVHMSRNLLFSWLEPMGVSTPSLPADLVAEPDRTQPFFNWNSMSSVLPHIQGGRYEPDNIAAAAAARATALPSAPVRLVEAPLHHPGAVQDDGMAPIAPFPAAVPFTAQQVAAHALAVAPSHTFTVAGTHATCRT